MDSPTPHPLRPYAATDLPRPSAAASGRLGQPRGPSTSPDLPALLRSHPGRRAYYESLGEASLDDVAISSGPGHVLRSYLNTGLFGFASTALVMPFEVGKTLLQVQWVPKAHVDEQLAQAVTQSSRLLDQDDDDEPEDFGDENEVDAYFTRHVSNPPRMPNDRGLPSHSSTIRRAKDASGYIIRRSVFDESTKPEYTLPVIVHGGVMEMIKAILRWRGEGFTSLWKGQLTTYMIDTLSSTLQPILLTILSFAFNPASPSTLMLPLEHHARPTLPLILSVSSFVLTGFILSPLDLIRTRLIVQSSQSQHRKYSGPLSGMSQMAKEEGGWTSVYFHPHLLIPAFLDNLARPLLHLSSPLILDRCLRLDKSTQPVWWGLADLALSTFGLFIILPLETIRKRLQLQTRIQVEQCVQSTALSSSFQPSQSVKVFKPCVEIRPVPYHGMVDAIYRIVTEESGRAANPTRRKTITTATATRVGMDLRNRRKTQQGQGATAQRSDSEVVDLVGDNDKMMSSEVREVVGGDGIGSGLLQLYRGFNVGLTANLVVFLLGLVGRPGDQAGGWTEL